MTVISDIFSAVFIAVLLGVAIIGVSIIEFNNISVASEYEKTVFNQIQYSDNLDSTLNTLELHTQQPWSTLLGNAAYYEKKEFRFYSKDKGTNSIVTIDFLSQFSDILNSAFGGNNWLARLYKISPADNQRIEIFEFGTQKNEQQRHVFEKALPLPNNKTGILTIRIYTEQKQNQTTQE